MKELSLNILDIAQNSIRARATNVDIILKEDAETLTITVADNGCGMNNEELIHAMRPGAQNPLEERDEKDLGRFGLGLKTASFSQCRNQT